jgi:thiol-disulfide isomerase/thioredoxin
MKKLLILISVFIFIISVFPSHSLALNPVNAYLFYGEGCPHCQKEAIFLDSLKEQYVNLNTTSFEIYSDRENYLLLRQVADVFEANSGGVPFLVIEDEYFIGYGESITPGLIENKINECTMYNCRDVVGEILKKEEIVDPVVPIIVTTDKPETKPEVIDSPQEPILESGNISDQNQSLESSENLDNNTPVIGKQINLPIIGQVDAENFSLPIITLIMAFLDGFNPCAMWVLLFLISLLFGIENKKKLWIFGTVFLISSGLVYFLFMTAWLNLFMFIGFILWVRIAIGLVALASGYYNLKEYFTNPNGGCKVTGDEKRIKVFSFLKKIIEKKNFFVALSGLIILAFAVNLVELVCSLGLPAVYVQILSLANLSHWQYYSYLIFYVLIFIMPATIVFFGSAITLHLTGISTKHSRKIHLVSGIIMLVIGLLMIFKPECLMFG